MDHLCSTGCVHSTHSAHGMRRIQVQAHKAPRPHTTRLRSRTSFRPLRDALRPPPPPRPRPPHPPPARQNY
eukprot:scaffold2500_cov129-Isochrysis_galbana.AAC.2